MLSTKKPWDLLTEEQRNSAIKDIIDFYETEKDEQIGIIAAGELLDIFLQTAGIFLYNKGVEDSKDLLRSKIEELTIDIEATLKK